MEKKNTIIVIAAILIVAIFGGAFLVFNKNSGQKTPAASGFIVKMTVEGFSPAELTIKKDQTVTWVNTTKEFHWPASNLHPTHGIYPEFDPREPIAPGQTWSFRFDKVGAWRCHDHLQPINQCVINVVDQ